MATFRAAEGCGPGESRRPRHWSCVTLGVYGLAWPAPRRLGLTGINAERLRVATIGHVSAIVGDMARAPGPTEARLSAYDALMQALARKTSALLPARFATQCRDADELSLMLESRQQSLRTLLRHVRNRPQVTIRVAVADSSLPAVPVGPAKGTSFRPTSGSLYLRERVAEAARAREVPGFDPVRMAVRRWVRDERIERHARIVTVYHLVPRGSVDAYRATLERTADNEGIVTGPWPPDAFTASI